MSADSAAVRLAEEYNARLALEGREDIAWVAEGMDLQLRSCRRAPERTSAPVRPGDATKLNRLMRKVGSPTRYRPDGTRYQLAAGDPDPTDPQDGGQP